MDKDTINAFWDEVIIGIGFVNGFWIGLGLNPETVALNSIFSALNQINPGNPILGDALGLIGFLNTAVFLAAIFASYAFGGALGAISFFLAFGAGIIIFHSGIMFLVMMGIAVLLAFMAPHIKDNGGRRVGV